MKSKRIVQTILAGLFVCILTISSKHYTQANDEKPVVTTKTETQVVMPPMGTSEKILAFQFPIIESMDEPEDNTNDISDTDTKESVNTDSTEQTQTETETPTPEPTTTSEPEPEPKPVTTGICEKDGNVDDHWISDINQQLAMIPSYLLTEFQNDGWHIYCTDMDIDSVYYGGRFGAVMGTTNYYENRILIEDRQMAVTDAVIHEMGHWLDWHNGTVTDSSEFMNIYYSETDTFKNTFSVKSYYDQKELFAEAFWRYIISNQQLANSCPQLYEFMSRYI